MRKTVLLVSLLVAVVANAYGQRAAAGKADPAKGVQAAFDRLVAGIRQVDVDKVMNSYEKSERLLIFNNNGTATIGWDNVRSNVESSYRSITNVSLEITGLRIEMLGTSAAYVSCKWKQTQENDGKLENAAGRMTLIYKLVNKEWKITHRHTSPDAPAANRPVFPSEREN